VQTLVDFDNAPVFAIPTTDGRLHEGMLLEGPQGWGEFAPDESRSPEFDARWLTAAIEAGTVGWPDPVRGRVPVAVAIPAVDPLVAARIAAESGCRTADVQVTGTAQTLDDDIARLHAVRAVVGPNIRCHLGVGWELRAIPLLAADELQYIRVTSAEEARAIQSVTDVPLAADITVGTATDIAIVNVGKLGGVRRALRKALDSGLPCVVTAPPQTSIGLAGAVALAGALPEPPLACSLGKLPTLAADVVTAARALIPRDGYLPVAPMPAAPDRDRLKPFIVEGDRVGRWRERLAAARSAL
jgi:O-succinylbenzoate synthase